MASRPSILAFALALLLAACGDGEHDEQHDHDHDHNGHRLTVWEGDREAFAHFEIHEGSGRIEGTLYLSIDHEPLTDPQEGTSVGWIRLGSASDGDESELVLRAPGRADFELFFGESDEATLSAELRLADGESWEVELGVVDRRAGEPSEPAEELAVYEKSSQWRLPFAAELAQRRQVDRTVAGTGRVSADPRHAVTISAPVEGRVGNGEGLLPTVGARLEPGAPLLALAPTLGGEGSWVDARLSYLQARDAFERAQRLLEAEAISRSDFQERERMYEARRAGYEAAMGTGAGASLRIDDRGDHLRLATARAGVVAQLHVHPGATVGRGAPLLDLYDPGHLHLDILAFSDELRELGEITTLEIGAGRGDWTVLEAHEFSIVGRDAPGDAAGTRSRLSVVLEQGEGPLRIDQPVQVLLRREGEEEALVVPSAALFDEHSHKVVFVQHSGDQFERRIVEVGARTSDWVVIAEGLEEGERVVTRGVYPVHLATAGITIEDSHDH